jgi:ATP-dependent DNA ligase
MAEREAKDEVRRAICLGSGRTFQMVLARGPLCEAWTTHVKPRRSTHRSPARFIARTLDGAVQAPFPDFIEPCNPTLRKLPPPGPAGHEIKHDGYRVQAHFDGEPRIYTRRGNEWAARMPTIAAALKALPANNLVLDGELVALDRTGKPSFYELPSEL